MPWLTLADVHQLRDGTQSVVENTAEKISVAGIRHSSAVPHPAGTVAMSRTASVGFTCIMGTTMATSQDFVTWTCGDQLDNRFLLWALRGDRKQILSRMQGSTHKTIYMPDLEDLKISLPSLAEQRAIADYLDTETARIDALIAKKQQLIHLLEERWGQYVRRELRSAGPSVPLKRGWTVTDCKHRTPTYQLSGFPVVSPGDATPGRLDLSRCHRFVDQDEFANLTDGGRRPQLGEIVYSRNASIGIACFVDTNEPFCMGQDVCLITSRTNDCLFLAYTLNSLGVDQLEELKLGSTFSRVNISQILELEVPLPPPEQQREAAARIDDRKRLHDRTIETNTQQVGLLAEHRQALITAAVTGGLTVAEVS